MDGYEHLTRDELISRIRELEAVREGGHADRGAVAGFPEFGVRERQEFDASPLPIRIFDRETLRYLAVNDAASRLYGYSREEFLALTPLHTRVAEEHPSLYATLAAPTGYMRHMGPRRHLKKSGEVMMVELIMQDILFNGRAARLSMTLDVTERVRAQEALQRREQEFSALAENLPDLIARFDLGYRYVYANSGVQRLLGRPLREVLGRTQSELGMPQPMVEDFTQSFVRAIREAMPHKLEFTYPAAEGERIFEAFHVPETGPDGRVKSVLCIARDITERKQSELALKRNLALIQLLESLARAANEAVTPQAAMAACVELICRHGRWELGRVALFKSGRPGGTPPLSVWHAPDRGRFDEFIRATNRRSHDSRPGVFISRVLRDKQPVWVEDLQQATYFGRLALAVRHGIRAAFAFPIIVQNSVVALIEILSTEPRPRDPLMLEVAQTIASQLARVIERARAQQSNARLAAIVESSQDAIISRRLDGTVLTWNAGAERLFGYAAAEITGGNIASIIPPELRGEMLAKQALLEQGAAIQSFEAVRIAKDGHRIQVLHSMSAIRDASGAMHAVSSIMRDITQFKQIEEDRLARAIRQRDTLVREVHHRIKNNLQGVIGLLRQKVHKHPALAPEIEEAILQLHSVSTVYGLERGHLGVPLPLAGIVDGICSTTESITGCRVTKSYLSDSPQRACIINSEAVAVAVAINELVFNAIKHGSKTDSGNGVEVLLREAAGGAEIRITNRGELPSQFDLADDRNLGSGLELVKALLSQPGSDLEVGCAGQEVKVVLKLTPPLIVGQPAAAA